MRLLRSPSELLAAVGFPRLSADRTKAAAKAGADLAERLGSDPRQLHADIRSLIARVVLAEDAVQIHLDRSALHSALDIEAAEPFDKHHIVTIAATLRSRGVELRFAIEGSAHGRVPEPDVSLIKAVVRGHHWWNRLHLGEVASIKDLARAESVTDRYVRRLIELAFLAPDITAAILDGRQPADLTVQRLRNVSELPLAWTEQRMLLDIT